MSISNADILDAVGAMSVLELTALITEIEEKFGVSAAAVAVAAGAAGAALCVRVQRPPHAGGRAARLCR